MIVIVHHANTHKRGGGDQRKPRRAAAKLSRIHKPDDMSLEAWQIELRRQFGREQKFKLKKLGEHPVFSDFQVTNPQSKSVYRVAIRGGELGDNFCSCPDFTTNTLGTCKHIEFTLAKLRRQHGGAKALRDGFSPSHSEVYLRYGAQRQVRLRLGADYPAELGRLAEKYFDSDGVLRPGAVWPIRGIPFRIVPVRSRPAVLRGRAGVCRGGARPTGSGPAAGSHLPSRYP